MIPFSFHSLNSSSSTMVAKCLADLQTILELKWRVAFTLNSNLTLFMHANSNMKQITDKFGIFAEIEISQPTAHYIKIS